MDKMHLDKLADDARREYQRMWRAANRDKVRKHSTDYWRRQAEKKLAEQESQKQVAP